MSKNENNVRTLDFSKSEEPRLMPEDVFEGDAPTGWTAEEIAAAEAQFTEPAEGGTIVTADFSPTSVPPPPLTTAELVQSTPFIFITIPSLGAELPLDVDTAVSLFDTLGAAINEL